MAIFKKSFLIALMVALLTVTSGIAFQNLSTFRDARKFPPPGRLIEINGRAMHLNCVGSGGPTVILESGLLHGSQDWALVLPDVAKFTRACAYDRAGYGWSEYRPGPRTAASISDELSALLAAAGERPPFVLVGHSLGGILVRQFALRHPGVVLGMVFVDSSHEQQLAHFAPPGNSIERSQQYFRKQIVASEFGITRLWHTCGLDPVRPDLRDETVYLECQPTRWLTALHEVEILASPPPMLAPRVFQNMPVEVLTRDLDREEDPAERDASPIWIQLQRELATLSTAGNWRIVKGSSHAIHMERPGAVVAAIRKVWEASRQTSHLPDVFPQGWECATNAKTKREL
jgi:pimeloyl-ACP methyl ester carboxylesterase